jgi:hypothetical protein
MLAWVHGLSHAVKLVLLRFLVRLLLCWAVLIDGIKCMVKTGHSVLLCFMFGPTGLLSHILTKAALGTGPSKHQVA